MKYLFIVLMLIGCGTDPEKVEESTRTGPAGEDAESCTVMQYDDGAEILCPNGSTAYIYNGDPGQDGVDGEQGKKGKAGEDGVDGKDSTIEPVYVGYYCSRIVLKIGSTHYVNHGQLIPLTKSWTYISSSCEIRFNKNKVETK